MSDTASNIAKYILAHFRGSGAPINNLKLQKLLYYCQAWYLSIYDEPLFADKIEAWVHGPVVPIVYQEYKAFRWSPITSEVSYDPKDPDFVEHLNGVLLAYGGFNAWELEKLSHSEDPWKQARAGLAPDQPSKATITHESMKAAFLT
jgi:uncharacterized phage-associated protein